MSTSASGNSSGTGRLMAISDLHVGYPENREYVETLRPGHDADWLLVGGDVAEKVVDIEWALSTLAGHFAKVFWVPGNHELWTIADDEVQLRGEARYRHLVEICRRLGVLTPEDEYVVWSGPGGPAAVVPLFTLYDYSFRVPGVDNKSDALARAYEAGIVCTDEVFLHPDPYPTRDDWCRARVAVSAQRLAQCDPAVPLVLLNHYPLVREPTRVLRHPDFAQWCGTELTGDWHTRFRVAAMVYGHLHIPRTSWHDGVRFEEVSMGYPREWQRYAQRPQPRLILPTQVEPGQVAWPVVRD